MLHKARLVANVSRQWPIHQLDVKNAFLHGHLTETVYMHQPLGFIDSAHSDYVCLLQKSLYGPELGFNDFPAMLFEPVSMTAKSTPSSTSLLQRIISSLHAEFAMTDLGPLNYFLGISATRTTSGIFLSQTKYATEILERAQMLNCNPCRTPVDTEKKLGPEGSPVTDPTLYRSFAGALQYLTFTRPDLSYAVQQLCLYMHDPREPHLNAMKRDTLSRSSAEAKYRRVTNVVADTSWIRNLLCELHTPLFTATLVYCDNVNAVYMSTNPVQHQRTKHIEIDIHFVRDKVAAGHVRVLHAPSRFQYADIFTKGLPYPLFTDFRSMNALVGTLTGSGKRKRVVKLELCNLANEMGQPDLIYKFIDLANHQASLNSKRGAAFGFSKIAKLAGDALQLHLKAIVQQVLGSVSRLQVVVRKELNPGFDFKLIELLLASCMKT
ncbi:ribonuclease H-like domain-containing protein [Tanacetum coccineum]